ncbi:sensor histidine kinase [Silvanigrella aquatica]|uniref:histidine kinase n=1 Tax=Silvanigrella aquatica TaxID=1915309 RepID=A0A1L4CZA5_9BACT|nr:HAMP domain-containing sensor histidine kinase [Silvanigrella aquatica]APJ03265.1 hypothetical protein AXG55_04850 [Silvanigrella aquatica]
MLTGNPLKFERVFSNIISNAIEAMNHKGFIWINSKEILINNKYFVEFCIGNNNSYISKLDLKNIFDNFYTKNKKIGTGLGLAIAKKIISENGGEIWCTSDKNQDFPLGKVEFYFTIPSICTHL